MGENDRASAFDKLTLKSAFIILVSVSPLFFMYAYLGNDPGRGRAAAIGAGMIVLGAKIFWDLRRHFLYWLALVVLVLCHISLVVIFPWTNKDYPGPVLLPWALLDFVVVFSFFKLVEKITRMGRQSDRANSGVKN